MKKNGSERGLVWTVAPLSSVSPSPISNTKTSQEKTKLHLK
jgi:hypothetical protein